MSYAALRVFVISALVIYFAASLAMNFRGPASSETYPFFSWLLFYKTPSVPAKTLSIRILEYGGETLAQPVLLGAPGASETFGPLNTARYGRIIQRLGQAVRTKDAEGISLFRKMLERSFRRHPVRYEVVTVTYDPIERWRTGRTIAVEPLAVFRSEPATANE